MKKKQLKIVIGLGKTGYSCVRYLHAAGFVVAVADSRKQPPYLSQLRQNFPEVEVKLGKFAVEWLARADELIISPGVWLGEPTIVDCVKRGVPVVGDMELFARAVQVPVVGITGSNGKSTVTSLLGEMAKKAGLQVQVGGNLGTPVLDFLAKGQPDLYVLELSSFQLEATASLHLTAATILNISDDHMDRYQNLEEYLRAKQRIYMHCGCAVVNRDDSVTYAGLNLPRMLSFGLQRPVANNVGLVDGYLVCGAKRILLANELRIKGKHQVANALAAVALGVALDLPWPAMQKALREYPGLPHRCQKVVETQGVTWFNDSKGTNVGATLAAITGLGEVLSGKLVLILGGQGKGADFTPLKMAVEKYVSNVILIGEDAGKIAKDLAAKDIVDSCAQHFAKSMQEAVCIAAQLAVAGDAVLLSPACASFDMFENFEHRGEVFMRAVLQREIV